MECSAQAGPEIAMREYASGQIKKGVRSIGMGGDGATWGNYALVARDAGTMIVDYGLVHFMETTNSFSFGAVGFTSPTFWDDAALYVIAMSQHATDLHVWTETPASATRPPSRGDGSNEALFLKFGKPLSKTVTAGILLSYELSQMTLLPDAQPTAIRYQTAWRPSGGAGVTWQPTSQILTGVRVILNHDAEQRTDAQGVHEGLARSYEYRAGISYSPWPGGIADVGIVGLDRHNAIEGTSTFDVEPTLGVEQAIIPTRVWVRGGRDETTWTSGMSVRVASFKVDLAYMWNLAAIRTADVFGKRNAGLFLTFTYHYLSQH